MTRIRYEARSASLYTCPFDDDANSPTLRDARSDRQPQNIDDRVLFLVEPQTRSNAAVIALQQLLETITRLKVRLETTPIDDDDGDELLLELGDDAERRRGRFSLVVLAGNADAYERLPAASRVQLERYAIEHRVGVLTIPLATKHVGAETASGDIRLQIRMQVDVCTARKMRTNDLAVAVRRWRLASACGCRMAADFKRVPRCKYLRRRSPRSLASIETRRLRVSRLAAAPTFGRFVLRSADVLGNLLGDRVFAGFERYVSETKKLRSLCLYFAVFSYIQIDIDDVFVGTAGTRLVPADV